MRCTRGDGIPTMRSNSVFKRRFALAMRSASRETTSGTLLHLLVIELVPNGWKTDHGFPLLRAQREFVSHLRNRTRWSGRRQRPIAAAFSSTAASTSSPFEKRPRPRCESADDIGTYLPRSGIDS